MTIDLELERDSVVTTRTYRVSGAPKVHKSYSIRAFQPTALRVEWQNNEFLVAILAGPAVLKDGSLSSVSMPSQSYYSLRDLPDWLVEPVMMTRPDAS